MISRSSQRGTFQLNNSLKRLENESVTDEEAHDKIEFFKSMREVTLAKEETPEWKQDNMEYDLRTTDWILEKVRKDEVYAQNLYAAMCNRDFIKNDIWPILQEKKWSCSWRYAGGIIADMQQKGDYIDWYCSGIRNDQNYDPEVNIKFPNGYVPESVVTDEIQQDLLKLGWTVCEEDKN
jgi:hypothetical protein